MAVKFIIVCFSGRVSFSSIHLKAITFKKKINYTTRPIGISQNMCDEHI